MTVLLWIREGIRKDIFARQRLFWKVYEAERRRRLAYLRWKTLMDKRHGWISTKAEGNRNTLKQRMQRNVLERSVEKFIAGYDTVGIRASYQKKIRSPYGFLAGLSFASCNDS